MNYRRLTLLVLAFLPAQAICYEWKSHNSMANQARRLAIRISADADLARFLQDFDAVSGHGNGRDLDTRAGDANKNAFTDEDHNEGEVEEFTGCRYRERDCWHAGFTLRFSLWVAPCTLDHFFPRLPLPLPNQDATVHARRYFDMAEEHLAASLRGRALDSHTGSSSMLSNE